MTFFGFLILLQTLLYKIETKKIMIPLAAHTTKLHLRTIYIDSKQRYMLFLKTFTSSLKSVNWEVK